jgi:hypothetical protein
MHGWLLLYSFEGKITQLAKVLRANHGFKNGFFSAKLGTKSISLFAMYTIIGTNTVSNP